MALPRERTTAISQAFFSSLTRPGRQKGALSLRSWLQPFAALVKRDEVLAETIPLCFAVAVLALLAPGTCVAQVQMDREFQECPECPVMVGIPAGKFVMGSPRSENGRFNSEGPQHEVTIKAFALGKYNVTSEQFLTFLRETGYQPPACNSILDMKWNSPGHGRASAPYSGEPPRWPAVCLDWHDAERYIAWLNDKVRIAHPAMDHTQECLSPADRGRVGICRAGRHGDGALVGQRHRSRQGQLQRLRQQVDNRLGLSLLRRRGDLGLDRHDFQAALRSLAAEYADDDQQEQRKPVQDHRKRKTRGALATLRLARTAGPMRNSRPEDSCGHSSALLQAGGDTDDRLLALMAFAGLLEALQGLTPDRVPDLPTAFSGAAGVLSAALVASSWPNRAKLTLARPRQI